jgi:hypothetical protein
MFTSKKVLRFVAVVAPAATMIASRAVYADNIPTAVNTGISDSSSGVGFGSTSLSTIFSDIVNTLLEIVGAIAVIMLVIGGLQYVLSGGDSKRVESAKNTILFAVVGLVIASLALAIIKFVTGKV